MNTSSNEVLQKAGNDLQQDNVPRWLKNFLGKTFFDKCLIHDLEKNEHNKYCITCDASICKFCIISEEHKEHNILTIYRHVYQNVVPLNEMGQHLNCDNIQPYKCNKKLVVSLDPLPHKGSCLLLEGNDACTTCKRKLMEPNRFCFCSIACQFEAIMGERIVSRFHEAGGSMQQEGVKEVEQVVMEQPEPQVTRRRRRKGVPHRAPLF